MERDRIITDGSASSPISPGFRGRGRTSNDARIPPGQHETRGFPVLSAGPTPRVSLGEWDLEVLGRQGSARWKWDEFQHLPHETITRDIHCVTRWSKLDTVWRGVSLDTLIAEASRRGVEPTPWMVAESDDGYSANVPLADLTGGRAWIVTQYQGEPLAPDHGGPARLLVPHLYFWKSAKWVRRLRFMDRDEPGFWESRGYHLRGDPWREQRYAGDP